MNLTEHNFTKKRRDPLLTLDTYTELQENLEDFYQDEDFHQIKNAVSEELDRRSGISWMLVFESI
ncbi:hypothetical protein [Vibrio harveyi]|uniref:hypothetical protein n=1 Tax=Vibrio harveyi TaxID=669 RepID=UPI00238082D4|nr:hypothetical protein [Vibrio harveyi]